MATPSIAQDKLPQLAKRIAHVENPRQHIRFDSHVRGTANDQSDIDLLIVEDRGDAPVWSRRRVIGDILRGLPRVGVAVDVLFYTQDEVEKWQDTTNHVVSKALREGKVIYERA